MSGSRWFGSFITALGAVLAIGVAAPAVTTAGGTPAAPAVAPAPPGSTTPSSADPSIRLIAPEDHIDVPRFKGQPIFVDPGIYVAATNGTFRVDAVRTDYDQPVTAAQVIGTGASRTERPLPDGLVKNFNGLPHFFHVVVRDANGKLVLHKGYTFCPSGQDARISPDGPLNQTFPRGCVPSPFTLGEVWGIDRGWATQALGYQGIQFNGPNGKYTLTMTLSPAYAAFFHVPSADATSTVTLKVAKGTGGCQPICPPDPGEASSSGSRVGPLGAAPTITNPDPNTLPDLIPLPAWGITIAHQNGKDYIDFSASVWDKGPAQLVVEGYRRKDSNIMDAWQYFFRGSSVVGRAKVGTLHYDSAPGHEHWHFQQFARYALLDSSKQQTYVSRKDGFCLAPTDAIDMTVPNANWNPGTLGFGTVCGGADSLWTREVLPTGWADTYVQTLPGQSLDITAVPNGIYYIEVRANPTGELFEKETSNDQTLRKIELGGTPGHRTVTAFPWHGLNV